MTATLYLVRPNVAPVVCQPWCTDGDGHPDETLAEDQTCYSARTDVDLSRLPRVKMDDGEVVPQVLEVMLCSGPCQPTSVVLHSEDLSICVDLTFKEARALADAFVAAVELAEGGA